MYRTTHLFRSPVSSTHPFLAGPGTRVGFVAAIKIIGGIGGNVVLVGKVPQLIAQDFSSFFDFLFQFFAGVFLDVFVGLFQLKEGCLAGTHAVIQHLVNNVRTLFTRC